MYLAELALVQAWDHKTRPRSCCGLPWTQHKGKFNHTATIPQLVWHVGAGLAVKMRAKGVWFCQDGPHDRPALDFISANDPPFLLPSQILVSSFSSKPLGHSQWKLPKVLMQDPPWHRPGSSWHSLMSVKNKMRKDNLQGTHSTAPYNWSPITALWEQSQWRWVSPSKMTVMGLGRNPSPPGHRVLYTAEGEHENLA